MIDFYAALKTIISRGEYLLDNMEDRVNKCWLETRITDEQRDELLALAAESARDEYQIDIAAKFADHDERIYALEHPIDQYPVWQQGQVTKKGEIVRYDVTGDGEYNLCLFDGGNAQTALFIGKIQGWYLLDRELNKVASFLRNAEGTFDIMPIESA